MSFVNTIDVLGDEVVFSSIFDSTINEFKDNTLTEIGNYAFAYCLSLTIVDTPNLNTLSMSSFENCSALKAVILRSETMCSLTGMDAFQSTPIASGTGYIYVPSALVDSYKTAPRWYVYANQFRALEDYTVDGTITGELDPNKI